MPFLTQQLRDHLHHSQVIIDQENFGHAGTLNLKPQSWASATLRSVAKQRRRLACELARASRLTILAFLAAARRQNPQARRPRYDFVTGPGSKAIGVAGAAHL